MSATVEYEVGQGTRAAPGREAATARLARYAAWQLRDFMRERGVWIAALGVIVVWIFRLKYDYSAIAQSAEYARQHHTGWTPPSEAQYFRMMLAGVFDVGTFVATLIASHGVVSRDRERGYQRFLFAKPVSVVRYYLQAFLVNGAGLLLVLGALIGLTGVLFTRVPPGILPMLAYAGAQYLMIGGLVMLLSTFARYDFALGALLTGVAAAANAVASERGSAAWLKAAALLLPPVTSLGLAASALSSGGPVAGSLLAPVCYGVIYVSAALFVLRRRSIAG